MPSVRTINVPKKSKKNTIGANQNFFLTLKNSQNSNKIDNFDINNSLIKCEKIVFHTLDLFELSKLALILFKDKIKNDKNNILISLYDISIFY